MPAIANCFPSAESVPFCPLQKNNPSFPFETPSTFIAKAATKASAPPTRILLETSSFKALRLLPEKKDHVNRTLFISIVLGGAMSTSIIRAKPQFVRQLTGISRQLNSELSSFDPE